MATFKSIPASELRTGNTFFHTGAVVIAEPMAAHSDVYRFANMVNVMVKTKEGKVETKLMNRNLHVKIEVA